MQEVSRSSGLPALIDHERPNSSSGARSGTSLSRPAESEGIKGAPQEGSPQKDKVVKRPGMQNPLWAKFQKAADPSLSTADTAQSSAVGEKDVEARNDSPSQAESSLPAAEDARKAKLTRRHSTVDGFPSRRVEEMKDNLPKRHSTLENSLPDMSRELQKSPEESSQDSKKALLKRSQSESFLPNKDISRRHSIQELPSQSLSPEKSKSSRRFSTIESGAPSSSSSSMNRRGSCPGGMDPAQFAVPEGPSEKQPERKKSVMDMSPRTARRFLIHQHRVGAEETEDGAHHSSSRHHRQGSKRRGTVHLGAESLAIITEKKEEAAKEAAIDPTLHGFLVGDAVTMEKGPDEGGPWKDMGEGEVAQGRLPYRKGMVNVFFPSSRETFNIRACNLFNLTDPMRSGDSMLHLTQQKTRGRAPGASNYTGKIDQSTNRGDRGEQVVTGAKGDQDEKHEKGDKRIYRKYQERRQASTIEANVALCGSTLEGAGMEPGDLVGSTGTGGVLGTVVKEGKNGDVFVNTGEMGIRSFNIMLLTKIQSSEEDKEDRAFKARFVDGKSKKSHTMTMDQASGPFGQTKQEKAAADSVVSIANGGIDTETGLKTGDVCRIKDADENPMWAVLGIGVVRGPGEKAGTMQVQFDCGGEYWTFFIDKLEKLDKSKGSDRKMKMVDPIQLRRRGSI